MNTAPGIALGSAGGEDPIAGSSLTPVTLTQKPCSDHAPCSSVARRVTRFSPSWPSVGIQASSHPAPSNVMPSGPSTNVTSNASPSGSNASTT